MPDRKHTLAAGIRCLAGALLAVLVADMAWAADAPPSRLKLYPPTPGVTPATRLQGTVQQHRLFLTEERIWHADSPGQWFAEVAFGRFAADGPVQVELVASGRNWGPAALRELGRDLPLEANGRKVSFRLPGPGQYYLQAPELASSNGTFTVVFWVDDLSRLERTHAGLQAEGALDVSGSGIKSDPQLDQTQSIQALLDRGGTILFPEGVYRSGTLRVRSNTTVYLAPGAVLRALDREEALGAEFISIDGAHNVRLCGQGVFDANSLRRHRRHNVHHVNITSSQDVAIEDLLFEDSNSWAIHIRKSDRLAARNVKIFSGKDGFDPDASRDVNIDRAFIVSGDDGIAVKNRFPEDADGKVTERVAFRNSIVCSMKSALKIGTETRGPIREVTFENCDVFDGERGVVLYARDGGPIERATWRNLRLFMHNWPKEKESGAVFHLNIERRQGATPVRECLIEHVTANWIYRSAFGGLPEAPLSGLTLRDITVRAEPPKSGRPHLFEAGKDVRMTIDGLAIDWQGNESKWAGVVSGDGVRVSE